MKLEEILSSYAFNDGQVLSFKIDISDQSCTVVLKVRKHLGRQQFRKCLIDLVFAKISNINISEDFRTCGGYSDITFIKTADEEFYLSLDPYSNLGQPNDEDNLVIISRLLSITYEDGNNIQIT